MSISDQERRDLFNRLEAVLGHPQAVTLMELLPPVGWGDVARQGDVALVRGEIAEVRGEIAAILPKVVAANIASMIGVAGVVIAAGAAL